MAAKGKGKAGKAASANDDLDELLANINSAEPARSKKSKTVRCVHAGSAVGLGAAPLTSPLGFRALHHEGRPSRWLRQQQAPSMPRRLLPRAGIQPKQRQRTHGRRMGMRLLITRRAAWHLLSPMFGPQVSPPPPLCLGKKPRP